MRRGERRSGSQAGPDYIQSDASKFNIGKGRRNRAIIISKIDLRDDLGFWEEAGKSMQSIGSSDRNSQAVSKVCGPGKLILVNEAGCSPGSSRGFVAGG